MTNPLALSASKQHRGNGKRQRKEEGLQSKVRKQLIITANALESLITK